MILILLAVLLSPYSAQALPDRVLDSIVAVVPDLPMRERAEEPEGSGVAIFPGGYVATAAHVMGRATSARLRLQDGRQVTASLVGVDPPTDLALLKTETALPAIAFGKEPSLADPVCAIGNPFGLGNSVSCGVVSALQRTGTGFNPVEDFIQTDATVNPGMSGGALVTPEGALVGLVTAIFTKQSDADIGVNFASSLALLRRVSEDLRDHGKVIRAALPFRVRPASPDELAVRAGVIVTGNADSTGTLRSGDQVTAIDGRAIRKPQDVAAAIGLRRPGETIFLQGFRGAERFDMELRLSD